MNWKFENFKKGPLSTIIGACLMAASVYVFIKTPGSEVFALALLAAGGVAFGLKDPKIPGGGTGAAMLAMLLLTLSSCVTYKACVDKYGTLAKDSVKIFIKVPILDTVRVPIPGDTLQGTISEGQLNLLKRNQTDTIRERSNDGKLLIKFWYNKYLRELEYKVNLKPDTMTYIVKDTVRVVADCPPAVVFNPPGKRFLGMPVQAIWEGFQFFAAWALIVEVLTLGVYLTFRRK